jgi:hypothetical protein
MAGSPDLLVSAGPLRGAGCVRRFGISLEHIKNIKTQNNKFKTNIKHHFKIKNDVDAPGGLPSSSARGPCGPPATAEHMGSVGSQRLPRPAATAGPVQAVAAAW